MDNATVLPATVTHHVRHFTCIPPDIDFDGHGVPLLIVIDSM